MNVIILLGAPGAGKGTVSEQLRGDGYEHVATGDMLRAAIKAGSEVGRQAEAYMQRGELVPDDVIIKLVEQRLDDPDAPDAYMFDGFPRTLQQADLLDQALARREAAVNFVFLLEAPRDILIQRLTGRRICRQCGQNYHVTNKPPKREGICDICGGELYQRPDDNEATIVNRLDVFEKQTRSLVDRYEAQDVLVRVDSAQDAADLVADIRGVLRGPAGA